MIALPSVEMVDTTVWVGVPAAILLGIGLVLRDSRALGRRGRRPTLAFDLSLLMFAVAFLGVLVARFLLLT